MLDFQSEFKKFDGRIKLSEPRKELLRTSRDAIKEKIVRYHRDILEVAAPEFVSQGSFVINTALNPIDNEEVDMDYGVYLNDQPEDINEWLTPKQAHNRIIEALKGHTQDECESKPFCVRVLYRNNYHLDLPIYIVSKENAYIANSKSGEWVRSDAKEFETWFYSNRQDEMVSRIIRYLKAWRDFKKSDFKSIELTIAAVSHSDISRERDDLVLYDTVNNILTSLSLERKIVKPVAPYENLWGDYSESKINRMLDNLKGFFDDLHNALNSDSNNRCSIILREVFGERFPKKDNSENQESPKILTSGAKPWKT